MAKKVKNTNTKSYKKKNLSKLRKKALKLWTDIVKLRDGKCLLCGIKNGELNKNSKPAWLNAHHIEDKMNYSTRFDPINGIAVCPGCHRFCKDSAHRSPVWFLNWLSINRPETITYLLKARNENPENALGWTEEMLENLIKKLETQYDDLCSTTTTTTTTPLIASNIA